MPSNAPIAVDPSGAPGAAATSSTVTDVLVNGLAEVRRGNDALTDSLTDSLQQPAESGAPSSPTPGPPSPPSDGLAIEMSAFGRSDAGHIADATNDDGPSLDVGLFDASVRDLGVLNPEEVRALESRSLMALLIEIADPKQTWLNPSRNLVGSRLNACLKRLWRPVSEQFKYLSRTLITTCGFA